MKYSIEDVKKLYGDRFYLMEQVVVEAPESESTPATTQQQEKKQASTAAPTTSTEAGITWKLKPGSKVIFILHQSEWGNRELTDLLKKIVQSLKISTDLAGFGLLPASPQLTETDFTEMPAQFGVVFDNKINPQANNPGNFDGKQAFFAHTLAELSGNDDYKRSLWNFLKTVKAQLNPG